ncbi:MAG: hypothetical protein ACYC7J_15300 [Syntrophales bacterium]
MKRYLAFLLLAGVLLLPLSSLQAGEMRGHGMMKAAAPAADYPPMPGPGKKVPIGEGYYLLYGFDKALKMGTVIMSVEVFTAEGKKDTSLELKVDADMPSMRGAHGTGDRPFQVSKKGDYLLPVHIMMPGDWELKLTVLKAGKVIFRGRYNFNV